MKFDHQSLERKWQKRWQEAGVFRAPAAPAKNANYVLDMFPYPSGDGLHVGHPEGYTATDIYSRYLRMKGVQVLHPMGWDAFGLPAENAAMKKGIHPAVVTKQNIENFKRQIQSIGFSYDWDREVNTTDPSYYTWTQWIFLQLFKRGLAYEKEMAIWWCPKDKTGLANEEVVDGRCERCETPVEKKMLKQWMLKITAYADRLLSGLDKLDWPEGIKALQRNWIGKSEGADVDFMIGGHKITVFTTRPDTLFGATYIVLSPEHPLVKVITAPDQKAAVEKYQKKVAAKSDLERTALEKDKTGVFTGAYAINPVNHEKIPVWIADYVLMSYGTGAIMAVPAHDQRDYDFAKKYKLPIRYVIAPKFVVRGNGPDAVRPSQPFVKRTAVCVIVRNPKNNTYLCISWKGHEMRGLPTGGVEEGEDPIETARREILEETGYKNLKFIDYPGFGVQTFFYHRQKKVNRWAQFTYVFFDLENEEREPVDQKEAALLDVVWKKPEELNDYFTVYEGSFIADFIQHPNTVYTGEGIMMGGLTLPESPVEKNRFESAVVSPGAYGHLGQELEPVGYSGPYEGLSTTEFRKQIVTWLENSGHGRRKIQYKLRDWVFSRQRYWGEPIPIVHCQNCRETVEKTAHVLNFFNTNGEWDRLLSGEKTIETRALNPEEPNRYFGNIQKGDYIKGIRKDTGEAAYFRVKCATKLKGLKDLLKHKELLMKMKTRTKLPTLPELQKGYAYTPDYVERIEKNGLIVWEVKHVYPGIIPLKPEELPLELPDVEKYEPTGTGESPLATIDQWVNVQCRICGHPAKRETNTMPQWAGSCWYYLRFTDPHNDQAFASEKAMKAWLPVDLYVGGAEHAVLHLLYARFWHMVLFDAGFIPKEVGDEPFLKLKNQGLILGPDGEKMSKSRGNVINPDEIIDQYGADTLRMYEMFMGPFEDAKPWDTNGIVGVRRFLDKVWRASEGLRVTQSSDRQHKYTQRITEGIENFRFNTCVSDLMKWMNEIGAENVSKHEFSVFLKLLSPFAPHIAEELWSKLGQTTFLAEEQWPKVDPKKVQEETVTIAVQVMGRLRGTISIKSGATRAEVEKTARAEANVVKYLSGETKNVIYVEDKLINFVI